MFKKKKKNSGVTRSILYKDLLIIPGQDIDPEWLRVDRILDERTDPSGDTLFLIKWCGLNYDEITWEKEANLKKESIDKYVSTSEETGLSSLFYSVFK